MTPPESRQTTDNGMATGAALTQSSIPRYHCSLLGKHTLYHFHKQALSVQPLRDTHMYCCGAVIQFSLVEWTEEAQKYQYLTRV